MPRDLAQPLDQTEYRITRRQQRQRITTVPSVTRDRPRKKQHRSNQRHASGPWITPRTVGTRLVRFTPPQHEKRDEGEDVIGDEEKGDDRNNPAGRLSEYDEQ